MAARKKALPVLLGGLAAVLLADTLFLRGRYLRWGATDDEVKRRWLGDELVAKPGHCTRAISIQAPAESVWQWIVQIGQDRGGFYSYTWLENLFLAEMRNADRVLPECQSRQIGDVVWMAPEHRYGTKASMAVVRLVPARAMVLAQRDEFEIAMRGERVRGGIWQFLLEPTDANGTRLIMRGAAPEKTGMLYDLVFDPAHFVMERKMMLGIKQRAEQTYRKNSLVT